MIIILGSHNIFSQSNKKEIREKIIQEIDSTLSSTDDRESKFDLLVEFTNSSDFSKLRFSTRLKYTEQLLAESNLPESDSLIIHNRLNVALYNGYIANYEKSLLLLNKIISETSTDHLWKIYAVALSAIGKIHEFLNNNEQASFHMNKLLDESIRLRDLDNEYIARMYLGDFYRKISAEEKSIAHYYRADEIAEFQNDHVKLDRTKSKIGKLLFLASEDSLSLEYHKLALQHALATNNEKRINYLKYFISYLSKTNSYIEKIRAAENYLDNINKPNHLIDVTRTYNYIADYQFKIGNYKNARITAFKSLQYALKSNVYSHICKAYLIISMVKLRQEEADSSFYYLGKSYEYLIQEENPELAYDFYEFSSELNSKSGFSQTALDHKNKSMEYFQIANNLNTKKKLAINFARYDFEKEKQKELAIEKSKNEAEIAERNLIIFSLIGVSFTIIIALFYSSKISKERKRNLEEVNKKNVLIEHQKNDLDDLNKMKDKFFSVIAHDLSGPVGNMMRLSKLVLFNSKENSDDQNEKIGSLLSESSKNVNTLLQSLLLWGKVQMKVAKPVLSHYNLLNRISLISEIYKDIIAEKKINLNVCIDKSHTVYVDEDMIDTVFRNLVHNSIKYTPEHGEINIIGSSREGKIDIKVSDNGKGIDEELINEIFSPNENGNKPTRKTGMGLILVKEFIALNNGSMSIKSEVGKGTCVNIQLPTG